MKLSQLVVKKIKYGVIKPIKTFQYIVILHNT